MRGWAYSCLHGPLALALGRQWCEEVVMVGGGIIWWSKWIVIFSSDPSPHNAQQQTGGVGQILNATTLSGWCVSDVRMLSYQVLVNSNLFLWYVMEVELISCQDSIDCLKIVTFNAMQKGSFVRNMIQYLWTWSKGHAQNFGVTLSYSCEQCYIELLVRSVMLSYMRVLLCRSNFLAWISIVPQNTNNDPLPNYTQYTNNDLLTEQASGRVHSQKLICCWEIFCKLEVAHCSILWHTE